MLNHMHIEQGIRSTGRTTVQIKRAPHGAYYIAWREQYARALEKFAANLGREDLMFVGPTFLSEGRWHGLRIPAIVVDHATWDQLTGEDIDRLYDVLQATGAILR